MGFEQNPNLKGLEYIAVGETQANQVSLFGQYVCIKHSEKATRKDETTKVSQVAKDLHDLT